MKGILVNQAFQFMIWAICPLCFIQFNFHSIQQLPSNTVCLQKLLFLDRDPKLLLTGWNTKDKSYQLCKQSQLGQLPAMDRLQRWTLWYVIRGYGKWMNRAQGGWRRVKICMRKRLNKPIFASMFGCSLKKLEWSFFCLLSHLNSKYKIMSTYI